MLLIDSIKSFKLLGEIYIREYNNSDSVNSYFVDWQQRRHASYVATEVPWQKLLMKTQNCLNFILILTSSTDKIKQLLEN